MHLVNAAVWGVHSERNIECPGDAFGAWLDGEG